MSVDRVVVTLGPDGAIACVTLIVVASAVIRLLRADRAVRTPATPVGLTETNPTRTNPTATGTLRPMELELAAAVLVFRAMSTPQLCEALRCAYLRASNNRAGSAEQTEWTRVRTREHLLNEIERRDPVGFQRWLATAPRPGSDPSRYLAPGR